MREDDVIRHLAGYSGTRILQANGDSFAIHDPDGDLPPERQMPWATVVTSNIHTPDGEPWDTASRLDRPGVFRLNLGLPRPAYRELTVSEAAPDTLDVLLPHPEYAQLGWVCVLNPDGTWPQVAGLLDQAYAFAVRKYGNRRR